MHRARRQAPWARDRDVEDRQADRQETEVTAAVLLLVVVVVK
jgi:hypothetical protein